MLPTEDLFVYVYVLIDDALAAGAIAVPPHPGPAPACNDAELLTVALVRHPLGGRRSFLMPQRRRPDPAAAAPGSIDQPDMDYQTQAAQITNRDRRTVARDRWLGSREGRRAWAGRSRGCAGQLGALLMAGA